MVCDENFGSGTFTDSTAVRPSRQSSPVSATFSFCDAADVLGIAGDLAGQRAAEAGEMGAAVALRDVVGEAEHVLVVAVVPPQRAFDRDAVALGADVDRLRDERALVAVEIVDEGLDAALVAHLLALLDRMALVGEHDRHAGIEEGQFAQAVLERREIELGHGEGLRGGQERDLRAASCLRPRPPPPAAPPRRRRGIPSVCSLPSRQIVSFSQLDSAFTTETPTPCRPPDTL